MKIYLIRHAESVSRDGMGYDQACMVSLSDKGRLQATRLATKIPTLGIETFFVSPLVRTKETFDIINQAHTPFVYDERLREHMPSRTATGKAYKDIRIHTRRDYTFIPADGESFDQAAERFISVLQEITKTEHKVVAIVSHALVMEAALTKLLNLAKIPILDEASYSLLTWDGKKFAIKYLNRTTSLLHNFKTIVKKILGRD